MYQNRLLSFRIIRQAILANIKENRTVLAPALPRLPHNVSQQQRAYASASLSRGRSSRATKSSATALLTVCLASWMFWDTDPDRSSSKISAGNALIHHDDQGQDQNTYLIT